MKNLCALLLVFGLGVGGHAAVLLDDDWDDGDRTDTNLPDESAWFGSTAVGTSSLSVVTGALTGHVRVLENLSSRLWITHFTAPGSPVELAPGETLKLTLEFVARNVVVTPSTQRGLRFGLFNFSEPDAARVTADGFSTGAGGGAPGTNVTGYMLNMQFSQVFNTSSPLQLMKRTDMTTNNLMGTTAAFLALGSGGGVTNGSPGFQSEVPYTLEFVIRRLNTSVQVTTTLSDTNGWSISHSATDAGTPYMKFDGFAIRPNNVVDTADSFTFTRLKIETIPFDFRITSIFPKTPSILEVQWNSLPGKTYEVQWRRGLEPAESWTPLITTPAQGTTTAAEDGDFAFETQRFYRVLQLD